MTIVGNLDAGTNISLLYLITSYFCLGGFTASWLPSQLTELDRNDTRRQSTGSKAECFVENMISVIVGTYR